MEEVLTTPQKDESISRNDQANGLEKSLTIDETGKSGGDDEVEVGATIGESYENEDATEVDSMDEDDDGVVIVTSKNSLRRGTPLKGRGFSSRTPGGKDPNNVSATATKDSSALATSSENASGPEDELQKLRFNRHFTAFDVNIESLAEHPWRDKNVDVSDYFNYGFTERTWLIYCEKQLRLRAEKGFGPRDPTTQPSKPFGPTVLNSSITASMVDSSIRDNPELAGANEVVSDEEESPTNVTEVRPDIPMNLTTESNTSTAPVPMMPAQITAPMTGLPPPPPPQMMAMHPGQQPYAMMPQLMPPMPPGRGPPPPPPGFAPPPHFPPGVSGMPGMPPPPGMFNFPPNSSFAPPPPPSLPLPPQPSTTEVVSSSDMGSKRRRTDETVSRDGSGDAATSSRSTKRPRDDSRDRDRDRDREGSKRTSDRERDRDRDRDREKDRDRDTRYRDSRDDDRSSRKKSRHSRSRSTSRRRR